MKQPHRPTFRVSSTGLDSFRRTEFATIQRRLSGEALERYTLPFGGGYYFVLPGGGAFLGESMLAA